MDKGYGYGDKKAEKAMKKDIIDTAIGNEDFSTLVAAIQAADLVEPLKGEGPFTVFAPTNDAFAKLPEGTVEELLKPENKEKLAGILTYHVVPAKIKAGDIQAGTSEVATLQGQMITVNASDAGVKINDATVTATDIKTSNGVIHVIDTVILPKDDASQ
ncbi:MAG: fasciclin domain-containing protein [Pseudomonadota bacterium]